MTFIEGAVSHLKSEYKELNSLFTSLRGILLMLITSAFREDGFKQQNSTYTGNACRQFLCI